MRVVAKGLTYLVLWDRWNDIEARFTVAQYAYGTWLSLLME